MFTTQGCAESEGNEQPRSTDQLSYSILSSVIKDSNGMDMWNNNGAIYLNIRGLYPLNNRSKIAYLRDQAKLENSSMILITESWLHEGVLDAEIMIPGYTLYRADRDSSRTHGGCAAWI